jgi:hypothetical protein
MSYRTVTRLVQWALLIVALVTVVTGLGITEFRLVTAATFGLLNKANAFKIHMWIWIPFLVLLTAHVILAMRPEWFRRKR